MYRSFYNLSLKPFQISSDPKFLWAGEKHKEALAVLKYGILDNKGFLLLTGDAGTGKTTMVNTLLYYLRDDVTVATVYDPSLELLDFYNLIADAFSINQQFNNKSSFLIYFKKFLLKNYNEGRNNLLIIDEAQKIKPELLDEIRMLSNIEIKGMKLLNIFFVGQSEFNNILLQPENYALRQRITVNYHIDALDEKETGEYIARRVNIAGASHNMFMKSAAKEVYQFSKGYPRLINIICDRALLSGFAENRSRIDARIIAECADELNIDKYVPPSSTAAPRRYGRLIFLLLLLGLAASSAGYYSLYF